MDNPNATIYGNASVSGDTPPEGGYVSGDRNSNVNFGDPLDNLAEYPVTPPNYDSPSAGDITGPYNLIGGILTVKTMGKNGHVVE